MNTTVDDHPIFNNSQFFIHTPMIDNLKNQITQCLWNGISGAAVYGSYRSGKTSALEHIRDSLINRMGETIQARIITVAPRDFGTIAGVYKNICFSLGFNLKARTTADDMSNLILNHFAELSMANNTKQVVLMVDELQRLNVNQLEVFAELYDGLRSIGANLFVLFAGNDVASKQLINTLNNDKYELIRGRFFTQEFKFYGIRTFDELSTCLSQYDQCRYPKGGATYTQFFLNNVVHKNWKLKSLSELIWSQYFENFKKPMRLESWPMQYFVAMVRQLITDFLPQNGVKDKELIDSMVHESINVSGLVKNLVQKPN